MLGRAASDISGINGGCSINKRGVRPQLHRRLVGGRRRHREVSLVLENLVYATPRVRRVLCSGYTVNFGHGWSIALMFIEALVIAS